MAGHCNIVDKISRTCNLELACSRFYGLKVTFDISVQHTDGSDSYARLFTGVGACTRSHVPNTKVRKMQEL